MHHTLVRLAAAAVWLALLGACASGAPMRQSQLRDRYLQYAGSPVDHINWLGRFDSWEPVSRDQLVVFTTPRDAYLIKVWSSCAGPDLYFARERIGLTSTAGVVYARLDRVRTGHWSCPIEEIRPIDYRRMQADLRRDAASPDQPVRK
jgi:hypothetical protein